MSTQRPKPIPVLGISFAISLATFLFGHYGMGANILISMKAASAWFAFFVMVLPQINKYRHRKFLGLSKEEYALEEVGGDLARVEREIHKRKTGIYILWLLPFIFAFAAWCAFDKRSAIVAFLLFGVIFIPGSVYQLWLDKKYLRFVHTRQAALSKNRSTHG